MEGVKHDDDRHLVEGFFPVQRASDHIVDGFIEIGNSGTGGRLERRLSEFLPVLGGQAGAGDELEPP